MEETVSDLQAQIDRLSLALHQWRQTQDQLPPMEQQLSQLTERCAEILNRWAETDQRHAQAVTEVEARLSEWSAIEGRLEQESYQRIREFEKTVEHEWTALRQMHEEPVKQLREQAAALGETCVVAANLALRGFERAETRFASLEADLQERLSQLSRDVQAALAEVRRQSAPASALGAGNVAPFPLEGVMRIHDELRATADRPVLAPAPQGAVSTSDPATAVQLAGPRALPEAAALSVRMESLEREVTSGKQEVRETATLAERLRHDWRVALVVGVVALAIVGLLAMRLQQRVNAQLNDAATRVEAAERQTAVATDAAARQIASTRADAERQISEARETAQRAQIVSDVLAAPDLIRFNLVGGAQNVRATAQLLWSRSRGLVFSASRLPAAPEGSTYQIWLLTNSDPVSAGLFVPDADGKYTLATPAVPSVPRTMTGVAVTLEPAGGSAAPSGVPVLARAQQ